MPRRCTHTGCTKQSSYGVAGTKKKEFCFDHKKDGMVDVRNKECTHDGCTKQPSYGVAGTKAAEFCSEHRKGGMVDVRSKRCTHAGCNKWPSFGVAGTKRAEFCSEHKKGGMVNVTRTKRSSGDGRGGDSQGRGRSIVVDDTTARRVGAGGRRSGRASSSTPTEISSSRNMGSNKRPRRASVDIPVAPTPAVSPSDQNPLPEDSSYASEPDDPVVKTEVWVFSKVDGVGAASGAEDAAGAEERATSTGETGSTWELDANVDTQVRIPFALDNEGAKSELQARMVIVEYRRLLCALELVRLKSC